VPNSRENERDHCGVRSGAVSNIEQQLENLQPNTFTFVVVIFKIASGVN